MKHTGCLEKVRRLLGECTTYLTDTCIEIAVARYQGMRLLTF